MTFIPQKKDAVYVRGVVIACGMKDDQGDTAPNKEGIKKIFTNYLKQESDVQHSYISNFNVHQLENTITTNEIEINGQKVPTGSWIASHMVLNPAIIAMIREGKLNGYSLGAIGDAGLNENISFENNFLNKSSLMYKDLRDYEELNPFFISFVQKASNGFTWEVMDYNQFLSKSSIGENSDGDIMTNDTQTELKDEMVKVSVVERLLQPFLNKASEQKEEPKTETVIEEAKIEEEAEELQKEAETGISNEEIMAKLEELPSAISAGVVDAMKELATQSIKNNEVEVLAKSSELEDEEVVEEEKEEEVKEDKLEKGSTSETEKEDDVKLVKSSNKLDEMTKPKPEPRERFLGGTKRDEYGRVRKYL